MAQEEKDEPFNYINWNTEELQQKGILVLKEESPSSPNTTYSSANGKNQHEAIKRKGNQDFGLTESIQMGKDGNITHYKFQKGVSADKEAESGQESSNESVDVEQRNNDSESTVSAVDEELDPIDDDLIQAVEKEIKDKSDQEGQTEVAGGGRPKRASAKKALNNIATINRLIENNTNIGGDKAGRSHRGVTDGGSTYSPWPDRGVVEKINKHFTSRANKPPHTSTSLTRWDKIEKETDLPDLVNETSFIRRIRRRIALRPPAIEDISLNIPLRCRHCSLKLPSMKILYIHLFNAHAGEPLYQCVECGTTFNTAAELEAHVPLHSLRHTEVLYRVSQFKRGDNVLFKCPLTDCVSRPLSWSMFINHLHFHWACDCLLCGQRLAPNQIKSFFSHMSVHIEDGPFLCPYCPTLGFRDMPTLKHHFCKMHGAGKLLWKCRFCYQSFGRFASLDLHLLEGHTIRPYACQYCGRDFSSIVSLENHLTDHKERGADHDKLYNKNKLCKDATDTRKLLSEARPVSCVPRILQRSRNSTPQASVPPSETSSNLNLGKANTPNPPKMTNPVNVRNVVNTSARMANVDVTGSVNLSNQTRFSIPTTATQTPAKILYVIKGKDGPQQILGNVGGIVSGNQILSLLNPQQIITGNTIQSAPGTLTHAPQPIITNLPSQKRYLIRTSLIRPTVQLTSTDTSPAPTSSTNIDATTGEKNDSSTLGLQISDVRGNADISDKPMESCVGGSSDGGRTDDDDNDNSQISPIVIAPIQDSTDRVGSGKSSEKSSELMVCSYPHCLTVSSSATDLWINHYFPQHFNKTDIFEFMCTKCAGLYVNGDWPPANHSCTNAQWIHICIDCGLLFENQRQKLQHYVQCKGFVPEETIVQAGTVVDPLTCRYCQETASSVKTLCSHMVSQHASHRFYNTLIACEQCTEIKRFVHVDHLWSHYEMIHTEWWANSGVWLCRVCGADHSTSQEFNEHMVYSHGRFLTPMIRCLDCSILCSDQLMMRDHQKRVHKKTLLGTPIRLEEASARNTTPLVRQQSSAKVIVPWNAKKWEMGVASSDLKAQFNPHFNSSKLDVGKNSNGRIPASACTTKEKIRVAEIVGATSFDQFIHDGPDKDNPHKTSEVEVDFDIGDDEDDSREMETSRLLRSEGGSSPPVSTEVSGEKHNGDPDQSPASINSDLEVETVWMCDHCNEVLKDTHTLKEHVRLNHELETKVLTCPCSEQPPLSTRKWVHRYWQHVVNNHKQWLLTFKWTCTVCGELFKRERDFEIHQIYRHKTDVKCISVSKCIQIVNKMEDARKETTPPKATDAKHKDLKSERVMPIKSPASPGPGTPYPDAKDVITLSSSDEDDSVPTEKSVEQSSVIFKKKILLEEKDGKTKGDNEPIVLDDDTGDSVNEAPKFAAKRSECKCESCGKYLPDRLSLRKHEKLVHPAEGQIKCEKCKMRVPVEKMGAHRCETEPTPSLYSCDFCCEKFEKAVEKNKHIAIRHRDKLKRCRHCGKAFISQDTLDKHEERMHPNMSQTRDWSKHLTNTNMTSERNLSPKFVTQSTIPVQLPTTDFMAALSKDSGVCNQGRKVSKTVRELLEEKRGRHLDNYDQSLNCESRSNKCRHCGKLSESWKGCHSHEEKCSYNPQRCNTCGITFGSEGYVNYHMKQSHKGHYVISSKTENDIIAKQANLEGNVITIAAPNIASSSSFLEEDLLNMLEESEDEESCEEPACEDIPRPNLSTMGNSDSENESQEDDLGSELSDKGRILALQRVGDSSDDDDTFTEVQVSPVQTRSEVLLPEEPGTKTASRKRRNSDEIFGTLKKKEALLDEFFGPKRYREEEEETAKRIALEEAIFGPKKTSQAVIDEVFGPKTSDSSNSSSTLIPDNNTTENDVFGPRNTSSSHERIDVTRTWINNSGSSEITPASFSPPCVEIAPIRHHEGSVSPHGLQQNQVNQNAQPLLITPDLPVSDFSRLVPVAPPETRTPPEDLVNLLPTSSKEYVCEVCLERFELECYLDIHKLNTQHF